MRATRAVTRGISDTFARALVSHAPTTPIDVARARRQHAAYVAALGGCGVEVTVLPPLHAFPDACFVEDCAVVAGGVAIVTRIGAPSRSGEEPSVGDCLARWLRVETMRPPATADGGDCLRAGSALFVGRSLRTNAAGVAALAASLEPRGVRVVEAPVAGAIHLKCVCAPLDDERILAVEGALPRASFDGFRVIDVPAAEAYAANAVSVNGTVLMAAGFPETARILAAEGLRVVALDTSEFRKADGALTCLSILVDAADDARAIG